MSASRPPLTSAAVADGVKAGCSAEGGGAAWPPPHSSAAATAPSEAAEASEMPLSPVTEEGALTPTTPTPTTQDYPLLLPEGGLRGLPRLAVVQHVLIDGALPQRGSPRHGLREGSLGGSGGGSGVGSLGGWGGGEGGGGGSLGGSGEHTVSALPGYLAAAAAAAAGGTAGGGSLPPSSSTASASSSPMRSARMSAFASPLPSLELPGPPLG